MWDRITLAAGLVLASFALVDTQGTHASASQTSLPVTVAAPPPAAAPSLADALAALSLAQRQTGPAGLKSGALAEAVASDLAQYLTPVAVVAAAPVGAAPLNGPGALGGLLDSGDAIGVTIPFSAQGRDGRLHTGMTYSVAAASVVFAPADVTVGFSGPLDGYGGVVILLAKDGSALVVTGLGDTLAKEGQSLLRGAPIGRMPRPKAKQTDAEPLTSPATPAPELYIEVRKSGRFVDPALWLR